VVLDDRKPDCISVQHLRAYLGDEHIIEHFAAVSRSLAPQIRRKLLCIS
jgi:hypothetical protein